MTRLLQAGMHTILPIAPRGARETEPPAADPKPAAPQPLFPPFVEREITRVYEESFHMCVSADAEERLSRQRDLLTGVARYDRYSPAEMRALGYHDAASVDRHRDFDIRLHAGIENKIAPAKLLALANGYIHGTLSKARFVQTVRLLEKPQKERRVEDIMRLGFPWHLRIHLMLGDWAIIGLMNGVIKRSDYDAIPYETMQLTGAEFWADRFPDCVDAQGNRLSPLPDLRAEDWAQIGSYNVRPLADRRSVPGRYPITLETVRIGGFGYSDSIHYLACIASARCQRAPLGPIGAYKDLESATQAFHELFWRGQTPQERSTFSPCVIV